MYGGAPSWMGYVINSPTVTAADLANLKLIYSSGAALSATREKSLREKFTHPFKIRECEYKMCNIVGKFEYFCQKLR